ncbi:hypothetical protein [Rubrivirga sp. IMCC45206]|uniref:hypothetical protein n=1 Tax=Rubrivirga sp. IMCC45206 TaxID=3391614 RepID=UPI00398FED45
MLGLDALTPNDRDRVRADLRIALTAGVVATVLMGAIVVLLGNVTDSEARLLIEAALPTVRTFASTAMVVSASTLALMLTILGLTSNTDSDIRGGHYERIRQIALADVVVFTMATLLLVVLIIPLGEATGIAHRWYSAIFYATTLLSAVIGGLAVGVMLLIYAAVRDLTMTFGPGDENPLLEDEETAAG